MNTQRVFLMDIVRTPWGIPGGSLAALGSGELATAALKALSERNGVVPDGVDHIVFGQARPSTFPSNIARYASLLLKWPEQIPAYTVQSSCASGMQALRSAWCLIAGGDAEVVAAGGADSFSAAPFVMRDVRYGFDESVRGIYDTVTEGERWTQPVPLSREEKRQALAAREGISAAEQEAYAAQSRSRFAQAQEAMWKYIVPVTVAGKRESVTVTDDEYAGQPPDIIAPYADGAAAALLMSEARARQLGMKPLAVISGFAVAGCSPARPEEGIPLAALKLLARRSVAAGDVGCLVLYEDTAAGAIFAQRALAARGLRAAVNPHGGALGIGKTEGGDGLELLLSLALTMRSAGETYGVAAMSSSGGQGMAVLLEAMNS